jgi:D-psicose/D-tagatose/L-ribulose 3-epimerase
MRISLCNEVIAELPFARQCELAREIGYDGLEIAPFTLGEDPLRLTEAELGEIRRAASDAGIAITGLHYLLRAPAGLSITATDLPVRQRTVEVMRGLCRLAADLGAGTLVHGSPAQRQLAPREETEGRKRAIECFAAAA